MDLEMQNSCKHAADKFAALDLNWWTGLPVEFNGPGLQEMRNIHLRLKPTPLDRQRLGEGGPVNGLHRCYQHRYEL